MQRRTITTLLLSTPLSLNLPACSWIPTGISTLMPDPIMVKSNGISMGVYQQGSGVPVIFCHGFPELAFSWRQQISVLSAAGYRAIAPDLRGYGLTDAPADFKAYTAATICDDLIGMMDELSIEQAVFCGHDWGQYVADTMPLLYPGRCLGVISIGAHNNQRPPHLPFPQLPGRELVDKPAFNRFIQRPATEAYLNKHVRELFQILFRQDYLSASHLQSLPPDSPERRLDLIAMIEQSRDSKAAEDLFVDEAALDFYTSSFQRSGFRGGINWYRAIEDTIAELDARELHWGVNVPFLYLWPEQDPINPDGLDVAMEDYINPLEKVALAGSGHFVQEEKPQALNRIILTWLNKHFPLTG